jgi:predicted NBD/HSP70 family sugar kinase
LGPLLHHWIAETAAGLTHAIAAVMAVIDFEAIVIDGAFPPEVRTLMVDAIEERLEEMNLEGLSPVTVVEGTIGADARAMGGASLPLLANFAIDRELLFKEML